MLSFRILWVLLITCFMSTISHAQETQSGVEIKKVLSEVKEGLIIAQSRLYKNTELPPLASVELALATTVSKKASGGFSIWVLSFGAKIEKVGTNTLTINLKPPGPLAGSAVSGNEIRETLAGMIISAAEGTATANGGSVPLEVSSVTAELKFVVERGGEGGAKFTIAPITAELGGSLSQKAIQTLKVSFAFPKGDK